MKIKNKRTGEIAAASIINSELVVHYSDGRVERYSLLSEHYEEPKEIYYLTERGVINSATDMSNFTLKMMKEIGNYFETKEEAEKAVENLKAWKRMKKCGLRFWDLDTVHLKIGYSFENYTKEDIPQLKKDLALIFGGEE